MKGKWADSSTDIIDEAQNSRSHEKKTPFRKTSPLPPSPPALSPPTPSHLLTIPSDLVVAHIDREIGPYSVKLNKQQYAVTVAPGVDMALVAALCICLDDKHNEKASSNAGLLASIS